ncbi:MAG: DUF6259 domain-containing protein, partial [Bacillota bacterium]
LTVNDATGAITGLRDRERNREYISGPALPPFRIAFDEEMQEESFIFSAVAGKDSLSLSWSLKSVALTATVTLLDAGIAFRATLQNKPNSCVRAFEYPILGALADYGTEGYLAHSYATGTLLRDPLSFIPETGGLRYLPYPESFSGASMQFFTYYEENKGGLYFAALDGEGHQKWLNVFKEKEGLAASHMAGFENAVPGSSIEMHYDFVVQLTGGKGWQEAASLYKSWALHQPWCAQGLARARRGRADWLREKAGYCTFGVNAGHDRTAWLRRYRADIGTPGFHVLGPDWTNTPQTFGWGVPGDMCDWVPTKFNPENLRTIRENGDYFAPFEFDFLVATNKSNPDKLLPHLQKFPKPTFSHDGYTFSMLCPCSEFTKNFHRERDVTVLREADVDAMYYDISTNNLIKVCMDSSHGHRPGGGKEITDGYAAVYQDTADALQKEAGKQIPLGTEMMNEVYLPYLDFYQARAWGQPCSTLETWPFREQMRSGQMRMIPLFDYVYHEFGAVRMDGWGKLVREIGDLFYYNVAKVYLWGGLYEINHEYSPMEELDGHETKGSEHYFRFSPQHCAYAPDRAAYVGQFARLRLTAANPYLAYGRMADLPKMEIPETTYHWYHYNHGQNDPSYKARGTYAAPSVVASAFSDGQGGYALFLANADKVSHTLSFTVSRQSLGLSQDAATMCLLSGFHGEGAPQTTDLGMLRREEEQAVSVALEPYGLYMLEIK